MRGVLPDQPQKLQAGLIVELAIFREAHIQHNAEHILAELGIQLPRFLKRPSQEDLRPGSQPQKLLHQVDPLCQQRARQLDYLRINQR